MSKKGHVPIRMCIGCRKKRKKEEMIRFTKSPEEGGWVNEKRFDGRGFYLCPDLDCLTKARKKNRGVGFLETMDFQFFRIKGFLKSEKVWDRGGRE